MPGWVNILIQVLTVLGSVGAVLAKPSTAPAVTAGAVGLAALLPSALDAFRK